MAWALLILWGVAATGMAGVWLVQRRLGQAAIVDVAWAGGLGASAAALAWFGPGDPYRRLLLGGIAGTWAFRLAAYLLWNRVLPGEEDGRYRMLREGWGAREPLYLFLFDQAQALFVALFALPFLPITWDPRPLAAWQVVVAVLIAAFAIGGEALADAQLAGWRAHPANRDGVCQVGLWRYSRHPNYFFEWLHWWAYVALGCTAPWGWLSLTGPALMLLFLYRVTGIPYTERRALDHRGAAYRDYQRRTSPFVPWWPREPDGDGDGAGARQQAARDAAAEEANP